MPGLPAPNGLQLLELLGEAEAEAGAADHHVHPLGALRRLGGEDLRGVLGERPPERVERARLQLEAGRGAVAAEAREVLLAGTHRREQVKAGDAAPRATPRPVLVERDHDGRLEVALRELRGDDPDDARMPAGTGHHQRRGVAEVLGKLLDRGLRRPLDLLLGRAPLVVGAVELGRDGRSAVGIVGQEELDARVGAVEAARRR